MKSLHWPPTLSSLTKRIISRTVKLSAQSIYTVSIVAATVLFVSLTVCGFLAALPFLTMSAISGLILKRYGSTR